jgi:hypothetical protein
MLRKFSSTDKPLNHQKKRELTEAIHYYSYCKKACHSTSQQLL